MKTLTHKNKISGFTLVETLMAISIFSISIVVMMSVLSDGIQDTNYTQDKMIASYLNQEGVEYVRSLRDTYMLYHINGSAAGWEAFKKALTDAACHQPDGCYVNDSNLNYNSITESIINMNILSCSGSCPIISYNPATGKYGYNGASTGFRRKINYQSVNANEVKISSTVYWTQGSGTYSTIFTENLFKWIESAVAPSGPVPVNVTWTSPVGVTVNGNNLSKPGSTALWDSGAISTQSIASGDGYVEFSTSENNTYKMGGLGNTNSNNSYTDIEFAAYARIDGIFNVFESGACKYGPAGCTVTGTTTYVAGDVFKVAIEGGLVKYYKNGGLIYTSSNLPVYPLVLDTSIYSQGGTITNAKIYAP